VHITLVGNGDTVTVLVNTTQVKVRLAETDTPERKLQLGKRATQALAALVSGEMLQVEQIDVDRNKRMVGRITFNGLDVNREMVGQGHA